MRFIDRFVEESNQQRELLRRLATSNIPSYIFGAGVFAYVLVKFLEKNGIKVTAAIVDQNYLSQPSFIDLPLVALEDTVSQGAGCHIFIGVTNYPAITEKLRALGFINVHLIDIPDYLDMPNRFITRAFVEENLSELEEAHSLLCDQKSKDTFIASLNTKLSEDLKHIESLVSLDHIYFPSTEFGTTDAEDFLDVGGFTGDTVKEFHHLKNGKYNRIISLEPSEENFTRLQNNALELDKSKIICCKVGAWHERTRLSFVTKDGDIDNEISEAGDAEIQVDTIDNIVSHIGGKISLMKLDINGAEYNALLGATKTIQENHPRIITRLHRKEDYFRIPVLLKRIAPEIKIYIRQRNYMSMMIILYAEFESRA